MSTADSNLALPAAQSPRPALPPVVLPPLDDNDRLVEMVAEVLDQSPQVVRQRLYQEEVALGTCHMREFAEAGIEPHVWSDQLIEFYQQSDSLFIGAAAWNRRAEKTTIREWIGTYLAAESRYPLDILLAGDGPGFDSHYFAECGHNVTYFEVSGCSFDFARLLFADSGHSIRMLSEPREIPENAFDVIVCLDVLEHVPDPVGMVGDFARYLRPNGKLIVHAPFFFLAPEVPTHLRANRTYAGDTRRLYEPHGFRLLDGRTMWDPIVLGKGDSQQQRNRRRVWQLRLTGLLLAVGRYWSGIHNWVARRTFKTVDLKWARELEAAARAEPTGG